MLIAVNKNRQAGFSLAELMIAVAVLGLLAAVAFPSFDTMLKNSRVRNGAESILNGLQRARAEAVARNTRVAFALGDGSSWQVSIAALGTQIEQRFENEGSKNVDITVNPTGSSVITFNNVGSVVANLDASDTVTEFDVTAEGASSSLRITIGVGGNATMCDLTLAAGSSPRAC